MKASAVIIPLLLVLVILGFGSIFVVQEWDQVVITQFGDPVGEPVTIRIHRDLGSLLR